MILIILDMKVFVKGGCKLTLCLFYCGYKKGSTTISILKMFPKW